MLLTTLVSCGQGGSAASAPLAANTPVEILDQATLVEVQSSFLEVSGGDSVSFADGSATLTPKARFQLERQALWLTENDHFGIRFRSQSASAKGVEDRRLALRRAEAVQAYLNDFGVKAHQFRGIDVEYGRSGTVTTQIDSYRLGYPDARQASNEVARRRG